VRIRLFYYACDGVYGTFYHVVSEVPQPIAMKLSHMIKMGVILKVFQNLVATLPPQTLEGHLD